ncbi:hypothetical protein [Bacillus sp. AG4(2022)]|uniref:hypothetical protein n=1 Tax=Bacillus sp. AG4(2022) TaxID=2962594 RepID=UPI0028818432|nr:hypothetical protein [Bacillus sp. AG4(2022)]MDT0160269.1 hypothetical protein [Bacillus sp. AG4(2022)]
MTTFKNLQDLEKQFSKLSKKAMDQGNGVKNTVIEAGKRHVQKDVYDVYTPNPNNPNSYKRTYELKNNWKSEPTADGIAVYNDRRDGNRYVAEIVETGIGYQYEFPYDGKARPFTENTRKELDGSSQLKEGLRKDLRNIGLDVK